MKICIIGAGVAGLQTAYCLMKDGHECFIYESKPGPGGVWLQNYDGYALQVPNELYEFCGMHDASLDGTFPNGKDVCERIRKYFDENELAKKCNFSFDTTVELIAKFDDGWMVHATHQNEKKSSQTFDFLVVCTGMYNTPKIPQELVKYNPIHSSDFLDASVCKNKHVFVIGGGKSAIDCAVAAHKHAEHVSIVMREIHWPVPRYILNMIPFKWGTYSRLGHFLLPCHWNTSSTERLFHKIFEPIKHIAWKFLALVFSIQFKLELKPKISLITDLFNGGQILTYEFKEAITSGKIKQIITDDIEKYIREIPGNQDNIIVCGTGFTKDYSIFEENIRSKLDICNDGLWLYKNIIPIDVPQLAFVGSEVSTFNNILTQHIQAQWLKNYIKQGKICSHQSMKESVGKDRDWKRNWMPFSSSRASLIQLHMTKYHDLLMKDMNQQIVKNKWWQWFLPIMARDYKFK